MFQKIIEVSIEMKDIINWTTIQNNDWINISGEIMAEWKMCADVQM